MTCVALVVCDLVGRPFADSYLHFNPANMFFRQLPNLSILGRWDTHVNYRGQAYGDLAAMKGEKEWREIREVVFQTDHLGFRNGKVHEPIDLIVLGDSFTAGIATSQDKIFSQVLECSYGRSVTTVRSFNDRPSWVRSITKSYDQTWFGYSGRWRMQEPSANQSRARLGCFCSTSSPSCRQIHSTR